MCHSTPEHRATFIALDFRSVFSDLSTPPRRLVLLACRPEAPEALKAVLDGEDPPLAEAAAPEPSAFPSLGSRSPASDDVSRSRV